MVVALGEPLSVISAPRPTDNGLIVPDTVHVAIADIVKLTPETLPLLTVTVLLVGLNVNPDLLGVMVYVPLTNREKEYFPVEPAVVVALDVPVKVSSVPAPEPEGVIAPDMEKVFAILTEAGKTPSTRNK